jgi:hypothetical protein
MERINKPNYLLEKVPVLLRTLALGILILSNACERWIDPDLNLDPEGATDVPMSLLIPTIELSVGYSLMGTMSVYPTHIWMQYATGPGVFYPYNVYDLLNPDLQEIPNWLWTDIYAQQLINARILIEKAEQKQSPYNAAVGQILTAYVLGIATDLWGDIPYSHALRAVILYSRCHLTARSRYTNPSIPCWIGPS